MATKDKTPLDSRLNLFQFDLGKNKELTTTFSTLYDEKKGDWTAIKADLTEDKGFTPEVVKNLTFTHALSDWSKDNTDLVKVFQKDKTTFSMRDIALNFDKAQFTEKLKQEKVASADGDIVAEHYAASLHDALFHIEPTAVVQNLVQNQKQTPISDPILRGGITTFLNNQDEAFNIKTTSIYTAFKAEKAFDGIAPELQEGLKTELKTLQRVTAISPVAEAIPVLMKAKIHTAYQVSEMPESQFIQAFKGQLGENGEAVAKQLHTNAVNARIRNEHALIALKEVKQGTGIAFIDKSLNVRAAVPTEMSTRGIGDDKNNLSWDTLFGDADLCECGECTSVYSAASYFVELMQYLRNNNLDPNPANDGSIKIKTDPKDISGTPLQKLLDRRPDLGCLQLTCANTNTILPYVDLVNEVMENYVVFKHPKPFNVADETSGELLAQPQHTEYQAYCILKDEVYPFTLPYHQPIDQIRIDLEFLGTSRTELIDTFRSPREATPSITDAAVLAALDILHQDYLNRAVDAECLGLTQEEYVILTKEAFVSKEYWDKQCEKEHDSKEYHTKIGFKEDVFKYYGYNTEGGMLDDKLEKGLTFVKKQFLPRTGIQYTDLVELLKTQCLNPNMPRGKAMSITESLHFSYRFLQTIKEEKGEDELIKLLTNSEKLIELLPYLKDNATFFNLEGKKGELACLPTTEEADKISESDIKTWVKCHFGNIGKMIVLENGGACVNGRIDLKLKENQFPLYHYEISDCQIWLYSNFFDVQSSQKVEGTLVGTIDKDTGLITAQDLTMLNSFVNDGTFISEKGEKGVFFRLNENKVYLLAPQKDTCNLDTVRLVHLDGTPLNVKGYEYEYDHIHRFIRLWRKMGWTIDEIDKSLMGLSGAEDDCLKLAMPDSGGCDDCNDLFDSSTGCKDCADEDCHSQALFSHCDITPDYLHQLCAVKHLLEKTGLELTKLLTFWTNISTSGEKSLYKRLFLTHNLSGMDTVFKADKNGNYLLADEKISDHKPVIMAAFNMSSDDMDAIMDYRVAFLVKQNNSTDTADKKLSDAKIEADMLTLANLSLMYRYRLFSKALGLKIPAFIEVLPLFGHPFTDADTTLDFMERWGKMEDAGFNYRQLNYLIRDFDDPQKPLSPTEKTVLQLAKTIYDGLNAIDEAHKNLAANPKTTDAELQKLEMETQASNEVVRAKAALLFDPSVVEQILGILEGTNVFITNAPVGIDPVIPDSKSLKNKLKYSTTEVGTTKVSSVQITGILTLAEKTDFNALSNDTEWGKALIRLEKQQNKLFKAVLFNVFEIEKAKSLARKTEVEAVETLIKLGDISIPFDQITVGGMDNNTAAPKRVAFLNVFLPYLRDELTHRFIVETLSNSVGLARETTDVLISEILMLTPSKPIYTVFEKIKDIAKPATSDWHGYLIPASESNFTFIVKNGSTTSQPVLTIDGALLTFDQQEDPTNEWWSKPQKLQAGKLYKLSVIGFDLKNVFWKTATSSITAIPSSVLLPDFASDDCTPAFILLKKAAILVSGFNLSADEIRYFNSRKIKPDFDALDFNQISLKQWLRLEAYTRLRNALPETKINILTFFNWTTTVWTTVQEPIEKAKLSAKIAELTFWKKERVDKLIADNHFNINELKDYRNEENLLKLQHAIAVADKIGMDIDLLFDWAKPTSNFKKCRKIADSMEKAIRAQYNQTDWEQVVKPLSDKLRNNQKEALIAYLLQRTELQTWGVTNADGLFEYFLIDVQMDACMETSRIKQAISSLQLFVMRCFLGLEEEHNGIKPDVLDRGRWNWMERYRVWEANRKVFLYPENWIESNLRDDKSPFFKELESELLQKDINKQNVTDALKAYLYKVDEVANMEVIGLYIEGTKPNTTWSKGAKLHVFSRTRNAPYFFYYRYLALDEMNWYAWEKMQVDIPSYDVENTEGVVTGNGCYLTPVVWNERLLIFFPQIMKKTKPNPTAQTQTVRTSADSSPNALKPIEYWEIKMAWSEYRNGKWTQKQLSSDAMSVDIIVSIANKLNDRIIDKFIFIPKIKTNDNEILIAVEDQVISDTTVTGVFSFSGSRINYVPNSGGTTYTIPGQVVSPSRTFQKTSKYEVNTYQVKDNVWQFVFIQNKFIVSNNDVRYKLLDISSGDYTFYHPYTHHLLGEINTGRLESFFKFHTQGTFATDKADAFGAFDHDINPTIPAIYHELKRSYSLYNWELFFHTPMMLADALSKAQQFEEAMKWYHFVFSPLAEGTDDKRFWQFLPFKETESQHILDRIFNSLTPNEADPIINEWRNHPFMPHVIARSRPVAYMKWVVMKYIDNLLAWGDYLFRQDTIESINQATQLYILAGHILGPRPMFIPKRGKIKPQTYMSLLDKWDAFSNALVELELVAPYSNQITTATGNANGIVGVGLANVFGFSTALYFCIPNNPKLMGYWDTVADRLFKIRHCLNIEGIFRKLPLFEPPIDPALLVKAAAQSLSISSVLNDLNTPMPNYRFYYLLQKALEICNELKSLGGAMLSAIEKKDNEALSLMRAKHESVMHNLMMEVKKLQLEEAQKSLDTLKQNRIAPVERMKYYLKLSGLEESAVPSETTGFTGLANEIVTVDGDSGLKLIPSEKQDMDKSSEANSKQKEITPVEKLVSILNAIPSITVNVQPFGVGLGTSFGGQNLGSIEQSKARGMQGEANDLTFQSSNAGKKGGFTRAIQERIQQANAAGYEIKQIDKQITAQQIRIEMANLEISNQQKQIDNTNEVEEFLKNKYTNDELYTWMRGSLKTLYHQVYSLAYDLAKKAEKTYRFERGLSNSNFIQSGYWDAGRDGLLAGEQLYVGLKQLEAAYQENRGYDYEVTKHISLRQINPIAVLQLKETGKCEFMLPEVLFDMDFPGHFKRRIKSVSLSIPCVAGPYTNINGTLRLLENKFRNTALAKNKSDYPEKTEETDDRFSTYIIPISAIAASSAQNESGMFELNFKDERYLPFEGAGVTSKWRLELPQFRQFDYNTISDVVMHLRYISTEGGERLKKAAYDSATEFMKSVEELGQQEGLFSIIDLQHDLPTEWHQAMQNKDADGNHLLKIPDLRQFLPFYAQRFVKTEIANTQFFHSAEITEISLLETAGLTKKEVLFKSTDIANKPIEKAYMIIRFVIER